jgi:hypothetical protein
MHLDDTPRDGLITFSDDDVLDLELIGRRLIRRHDDIRLLTYRHDHKLTGLRPQCRDSASHQTRERLIMLGTVALAAAALFAALTAIAHQARWTIATPDEWVTYAGLNARWQSSCRRSASAGMETAKASAHTTPGC